MHSNLSVHVTNLHHAISGENRSHSRRFNAKDQVRLAPKPQIFAKIARKNPGGPQEKNLAAPVKLRCVAGPKAGTNNLPPLSKKNTGSPGKLGVCEENWGCVSGPPQPRWEPNFSGVGLGGRWGGGGSEAAGLRGSEDWGSSDRAGRCLARSEGGHDPSLAQVHTPFSRVRIEDSIAPTAIEAVGMDRKP
jgi:hypothetical protein